MNSIRSAAVALWAAGCVGLAQAGDLSSPASGGVVARSKINVQTGMEGDVKAAPNILDTTTTNYVFGHTISRRALAIQVHVDNNSQKHDLLVHKISLEVCKTDNADSKAAGKSNEAKAAQEQKRLLQSRLQPKSQDFQCADGSLIVQMAGFDKTVLQGLADRGQSRDVRNVGLRVITAVGAVATPFPTVVAHLGHSFTPAAAAWNGPLVEAYKGLFPDYTVNQLIRLSNDAFEPNKVVPKTSSAEMTVFLPLAMLMNKEQIHRFRKDPYNAFSYAVQNYRVLIDAQFIQDVPAQSGSSTPSQGTPTPPAQNNSSQPQ